MFLQFARITIYIASSLLPVLVSAQQGKQKPPYDAKLLAQEPGSVAAKGSFTISPKVRGVKGSNDVVLWVTDDMKSLAAYKERTLLWKTDIVSPCSTTMGFSGSRQIRSIVSQSPVAVVFVFVGSNAYAELDRETGKILKTGVDPN